MPSYGARRRTSGNLSPSNCPKLSRTNSRLVCTNVNIELETKGIIIENHRKLRVCEKKTLKKIVDERAETRLNERAETRDDAHVQTRDDERVHTSTRPHTHTSGNWDPGGGPVKPQDFRPVAWWG